jgi:hypothetical protein
MEVSAMFNHTDTTLDRTGTELAELEPGTFVYALHPHTGRFVDGIIEETPERAAAYGLVQVLVKDHADMIYPILLDRENII